MEKNLLAGVVLFFLAGCSPGETSLTIYVGAGIRPPVEELCALFEKETGGTVLPDYAGSEVLLSKIRLAKQGDIYMPGDLHYVEQAKEAGMIVLHRSACYFVPTILVKKGNPKGIQTLEDLVKPGVRLGLGDSSACAIGRKSRKIFEKNGISREKIEANLKFESMTVNELGLQIETGSLDAVIVWDAIAVYFREHGEAIAIPTEQNVISTVDVGVLSFSGQEETARRFVDLVVSDRGREVFRKHGYRVDPPE